MSAPHFRMECPSCVNTIDALFPIETIDQGGIWTDGFTLERSRLHPVVRCGQCKQPVWLHSGPTESDLTEITKPLVGALETSIKGAAALSHIELWAEFLEMDLAISPSTREVSSDLTSDLPAPPYLLRRRHECALRTLWAYNSALSGRTSDTSLPVRVEHGRRRHILAVLLESALWDSRHHGQVTLSAVEWLRELGIRSAAERLLALSQDAPARIDAMKLLLHCRVSDVAKWPLHPNQTALPAGGDVAFDEHKAEQFEMDQEKRDQCRQQAEEEAAGGLTADSRLLEKVAHKANGNGLYAKRLYITVRAHDLYAVRLTPPQSCS